MKYILLSILLIITGSYFAQNTITVRKSDTTFNAFFYSEFIKPSSYKPILKRSKESQFGSSKKVRLYYVFGESGDVWYFTENKNYRKVKKNSDIRNWEQQQPSAKYYIKGIDIVFFPYIKQIDGTYTLGKVAIEGFYFKSFIEMETGINGRKMMLLK